MTPIVLDRLEKVTEYFAALAAETTPETFEYRLPEIVKVIKWNCIGRTIAKTRLLSIAEAIGLVEARGLDWVQATIARALEPPLANGHERIERDQPKGALSIAHIKVAAASLTKDDMPGLKRLIRAAINARASEVEVQQIVKALAKSLGVVKAGVEKEWRQIDSAVKAENSPTQEEAEAAIEAHRREGEAERSALYERCKHIAENPKLLDEMVELVRRMGVVSERRGILAIYLVAASRLHDKGAISLLRRGAAAAGKNFLADNVLKLIPKESLFEAVGGSPKSLAYYGGVDGVDALSHKLVYIAEAASIVDKGGIENEFATMLRVLISEGRFVYQTVSTQENETPVTVTVTKNGPIAVLITSARDNIESEMLTRLMVSDADESADQTQAIVRSTLADRTSAVTTNELQTWVDFQRWLELGGPYEVNIPFLEAIARAYGNPTKPPPLRIRRDMEGLKRAIWASAIIHAAQRERGQDGRIIAEMSDYEAPHEAFDHDMGSLYAVNVPAAAKAVVRAIEGMIAAEKDKDAFVSSARITYDGLMAALGINSNDTAGRRLKEAQRLGLVEQIEPPAGAGRTTARRYRILIPSSELDGRKSASVFPSPESVRQNYVDLQHERGEGVQTGGAAGATGVTSAASSQNYPDYTDNTACPEGERGVQCVLAAPDNSRLSDTQQTVGRGVGTDGVGGASSPVEPSATVRGVL